MVASSSAPAEACSAGHDTAHSTPATTTRQAMATTATTTMSTETHRTSTTATTTTASDTARGGAHRTSDIESAAKHAKNGGLVAFPTETVYGLGCHALNETSIQCVFDAKERPLTDPLIVHVLDKHDAFQLWHATAPLEDADGEEEEVDDEGKNEEGKILSTLCDHFWPGPLTLVAKADTNVVPSKIMAGTGYVAVRSPQHPIARDLLEKSQIPLAAPSANKFGHVSPTTANHVYDDLHQESGVWILEDDDHNNYNPHDECVNYKVGVESTVAKLERNQHQNTDDGGVSSSSSSWRLVVLRQGAVSVEELAAVLQQAHIKSCPQVVSNLKRATADHVANVAPGQTIRHYSPHVPSFLVSETCRRLDDRSDGASSSNHNNQSAELLQGAVILDYGGVLADWREASLAYRDLSPSGTSTEAARAVFECLRWAEQVPGAQRILFPELDAGDNGDKDEHDTDALLLAVKDRLTRAASGVVIDSLNGVP